MKSIPPEDLDILHTKVELAFTWVTEEMAHQTDVYMSYSRYFKEKDPVYPVILNHPVNIGALAGYLIVTDKLLPHLLGEAHV